MSRRKSLMIFVGICFLLVSFIFLPSFIRHNSLFDKNESNSFPDKNENNTLLIIHNRGKINHEVTVKLFDSKNTSIFNESYILAPGDNIRSQYSIGLATGTYIEVTLDSNITKTEIVRQDLSDIATLYIDIDRYLDDPLDLSIAVP